MVPEYDEEVQQTEETVNAALESKSLLSRARVALQALSEGKFHTVGGLDAVKGLRQRLNELADHLELLSVGIDLRQVQESLVEHAATYTDCPQVLGSMIQLVFCLDHIRAWLEQRDLAVRTAVADLDKLRDDFEGRSNLISEMGWEVKACTAKAAAMELELTQKIARPTAGFEGRHPSKNSCSAPSTSRSTQMSPSSQYSPRNSTTMRSFHMQAHKTVDVDLQALERVDEHKRAVEEHKRKVEELQSENVELRSKLEIAASEAAVARSAAEAAQTAAEQTAEAAAQVAAAQKQVPPVVEPTAPAPSSPLEVLEQLEPMLAGMPVGVVPGMSELQEQACDAYGHLRSLLMAAAAGMPTESGGATESQQLSELVLAEIVPSGGVAGSPAQHPSYDSRDVGRIYGARGLAPAYPTAWRSTSAGTSEEQFDTWRQAILMGEPVHGIHAGVGYGVGGGEIGPPRLTQHWAQESRGGLLRANRLS